MNDNEIKTNLECIKNMITKLRLDYQENQKSLGHLEDDFYKSLQTIQMHIFRNSIGVGSELVKALDELPKFQNTLRNQIFISQQLSSLVFTMESLLKSKKIQEERDELQLRKDYICGLDSSEKKEKLKSVKFLDAQTGEPITIDQFLEIFKNE